MKCSLLLKERICSLGANSFLSELTQTEKEGKYENNRVVSPESIPVHLNKMVYCNHPEILTKSILLLSYNVAVFQWITSCHKTHMTTRVITLWHVHMSTMHYVHFEGNKITF